MAAKRGRPITAAHGTPSAIRRHYRNGEPLCPECKAAQKATNADNYQRRKLT